MVLVVRSVQFIYCVCLKVKTIIWWLHEMDDFSLIVEDKFKIQLIIYKLFDFQDGCAE